MRPANEARAACDAALARRAAGTMSAEVALMTMLIAFEDASAVRAYLAESDGAAAAELRARFDANAAGCARIAAMLAAGVDVPPENGSVEEGIAFCKRLFDWSVAQSEEASVALYSLGDASVLAEATSEIVDVLRAWGLLAKGARTLEIGSGIGRMQRAIAPYVREAWGLDVSPNMVEAARRRCAALPNARFEVTGGHGALPFEPERFELVFAVDSFPYLVQSGLPLAARHVAEAARVLVPGGSLVILQFSYRGDEDADRRDVEALARDAGLDVVTLGAKPFRLWDGAAYHLRKPIIAAS